MTMFATTSFANGSRCASATQSSQDADWMSIATASVSQLVVADAAADFDGQAGPASGGDVGVVVDEAQDRLTPP
jgi:hypothetical protein